jgi:hypothetical protein
MFLHRMYNPYENMPCLPDNAYFRINTAEELLADINDCFRIYDVSQYLSSRIEVLYKQYLARKNVPQTSGFSLSQYVKQKSLSAKRIKYDRNLITIKEHLNKLQN